MIKPSSSTNFTKLLTRCIIPIIILLWIGLAQLKAHCSSTSQVTTYIDHPGYDLDKIKAELKEILMPYNESLSKKEIGSIKLYFIQYARNKIDAFPSHEMDIKNAANAVLSDANIPWVFNNDGSTYQLIDKSDDTTTDSKNYTDQTFKVVEKMPRFPGCLEGDESEKSKCAQRKMLEYIYSNLEYPMEARKKGIEGTIIIRYIIDKTGAILNPEIVRDIGGGAGEAGLAVVKSMPNWEPGMQRGLPVKVQFNLPIKFKLDKEEKKKPKKNRKG